MRGRANHSLNELGDKERTVDYMVPFKGLPLPAAQRLPRRLLPKIPPLPHRATLGTKPATHEPLVRHSRSKMLPS